MQVIACRKTGTGSILLEFGVEIPATTKDEDTSSLYRSIANPNRDLEMENVVREALTLMLITNYRVK